MGLQVAEAELKELQDTFRQDKENQVSLPLACTYNAGVSASLCPGVCMLL